MAQSMGKRIHIVPASLDYDRVGQIFEEYSPDRVHILTNSDPIESHRELNQNVLEEMKSIVKEMTMCREGNGLEILQTDFYHFEEALIDTFELIYREDLKGNEVVVNISGGTKPIAVALAFSCAMNETGIPVYYVPKTYEKDNGMISSSGVAPVSFEVSPLNLIDMADIIPASEEKREIILELLSQGEFIGVTEMLVGMGKISEDIPEDEDDKSERNRLIQKYHRHSNQLSEDGYLVKEESEYGFTESGDIIAKLIQKREIVNSEIEPQTTLRNY